MITLPAPILLDALLDAVEGIGLGCTIVVSKSDRLERLYANEAMARIFGVDLETMRKTSPLTALPPDERAKYIAMRARKMAGGAVPSFDETTIIRSDGALIPVEIGLGRGIVDGVSATFVFMRDVSSKREMEAALTESEDRFRRLADASSDAITVLAEGRYVYANAVALSHLRLATFDELSSYDPWARMPADRRVEVLERIARLDRGGARRPLIHRVPTEGGPERVLEASLSVVNFGGVRSIMSCTRDVTGLTSAWADPLGVPSAGVARELKNSLSSVGEAVRKLRDMANRHGFSNEVNGTLDQVDETARQMTDIISDVLRPRLVETPTNRAGAERARRSLGVNLDELMFRALLSASGSGTSAPGVPLESGTMAGVHVRLMVRVPVTLEAAAGRLTPLTGKKLQALLAVLAVERRAHSREELAALLWGDMADERARHNLRQALSKLRRLLGEVVITEGDQIRLVPSMCTSDVEELDDAIARRNVETVIRIYRCELLEGLSVREDPFDVWLREVRASIRSRVCKVIDAYIAERIDGSAGTELELLVRRRLEIDPACEEAHGALMKILWRTGRRTEAIRQHAICGARLREAFGAPTSAAIDALLEEIRADTGVSRPSSAPKATGQPPTVAVMPFENLADAEEGYLSDGISEDIITGLARFQSTMVIARSTSFRLRGEGLSVRELGERLGASYVVQGSLRRAEGLVRVNVQLVCPPTARQLWAHRFDGELSAVFALQDEVTMAIVSTLANRVEAARFAEVRRVPTESLGAHDCVLRGKHHHHLCTPHDCELAIEYFRRAIDRDETYALAHAWLACGLGQAMRFRRGEIRSRDGRHGGATVERPSRGPLPPLGVGMRCQVRG
jgi:PAS domain S-box-containing protein